MRADCAIGGIGMLCRERAAAAPPGADGDAWFKVESYLDEKEARYMSKAARFATSAAGLALDDLSLGEAGIAPNDSGVVLGTNFAASRTIADMDHTLLRHGVAGVRPLEAPYFSINLAASHISMKFGLRAFNITLTDPCIAGLEAIAVACQSLERRRAVMALAGAVEADPPPAHEAFGAGHLEASACVVTLERGADLAARGGLAYAVVSGYASGFIEPGAISSEEARQAAIESILPLIQPLLEPAGGVIVAGPPGETPIGSLVWTAIEQAAHDCERWKGLGADGCHASVSPVLALATIASASANALVFAASPQGQIVLLRITPPAAARRRSTRP